MKTKKISIVWRTGASFVVLAISLFGGKGKAAEPTNATDYSVASHWMAMPAATNKPVDVFYFYPTSWTSTNPNPEVCAIDNPSMLAQAPQAAAIQVTAFETVGNIFAPFYRQSNLVTNAPTIVAGIPTTDGLAAFDYYLRHFNHGRPFILCGHSQGANVLNNLLAQYMKTNPAVLARMIVAYVIGYPVTTQYLADNPYLKFAEGPGDTGVIVSYNTEAPGIPPGVNPILWGLVGTVINPLTWTRTETLATTNQGFGSFMPDTNGVYGRVPQYADARIDISKGVLICSTADTNALGRINTLAGYGIFHMFDYPFYYFNLRSNAALRTQNFLQKISADYDADGKADPAIYTDSTGVFTVFLSASNYTATSVIMGASPSALGLQPIPGDFDGDGKADPAVYQPEAGQLLLRFSSQAYAPMFFPMGGIGCVPVVGDFDGDCKADPAVYSAATSQLAAWLSGNSYTVLSVPLGGAGQLNASADYDGDSKADPSVVQTQSGQWQLLSSAQGYTPVSLATPGGAEVVPVPGDYDGDGKADPALYQAANGLWMFAMSSQGYTPVIVSGWGAPTMIPRPADYDGDGKTDPAVYAPSLQAYGVWMSGSGYTPIILSW